VPSLVGGVLTINKRKMSKIYFIFNHIKVTIGRKQAPAQETEGVDFETLSVSPKSGTLLLTARN
jgi:hypothetical protein